MRRTQIYLDPDDDRRLAARATAVGQTKSALIREAITAFLDPDEGDEAELHRLRAAVRETAGSARYLPPGAAYVEEMRAGDRSREETLTARRTR